MSDETSDEAVGEAEDENPVEIPFAELAPQTLHSMLEDLVTRDGTDYGAQERTTEQKVAALMRQLESGAGKLVFDPVTETIGLMTKTDLEQLIKVESKAKPARQP